MGDLNAYQAFITLKETRWLVFLKKIFVLCFSKLKRSSVAQVVCCVGNCLSVLLFSPCKEKTRNVIKKHKRRYFRIKTPVWLSFLWVSLLRGITAKGILRFAVCLVSFFHPKELCIVVVALFWGDRSASSRLKRSFCFALLCFPSRRLQGKQLALSSCLT